MDDHRVRDVTMFPLLTFQHCMQPSSIEAVSDCMDDVVLSQVVGALVEGIADTSLDDGVHVDLDYLEADAFPIVGRLVAIDDAYSAFVDQVAYSCFLEAYSYSVAAVDLDRRMACLVALEHCSVAGVAKNRQKRKFLLYYKKNKVLELSFFRLLPVVVAS